MSELRFAFAVMLVLGACDEVTCHGSGRRIEVVGYEDKHVQVSIEPREEAPKFIQIPIPVFIPMPAQPVSAASATKVAPGLAEKP